MIRQQNIVIAIMLVDVNWIVDREYIGREAVNVEVVEHLADDHDHAVVAVAAAEVTIHHVNVPIQKTVSVDKLIFFYQCIFYHS